MPDGPRLTKQQVSDRALIFGHPQLSRNRWSFLISAANPSRSWVVIALLKATTTSRTARILAQRAPERSDGGTGQGVGKVALTQGDLRR